MVRESYFIKHTRSKKSTLNPVRITFEIPEMNKKHYVCMALRKQNYYKQEHKQRSLYNKLKKNIEVYVMNIAQ